MPNNIRIEEDLLGTREVPADACYGVRIPRAIENFYISSNRVSDIPEFVRGMVMVKKIVAMANKELQIISKGVMDATIAVCDKVLNNGKCMNQLSVDVYQGDVNTPVSMNINRVLANIGLGLMGHQKGEYQYLSPDDHANKCQPTNDARPIGFRIAVYSSLIKLVDTTNQLREGSEHKAIRFQDILKMGCTQLQDAIQTTLDQEFRTSGILLKEEMKNIQRAAEPLLETNLDATAIGTGSNTPKEYSSLVVRKLAEATGFPCVSAEDLIEATSGCDTYVMVRGALKRLATGISKICNDLRLLSSGPRVGLNEINLPELQAGSSIMPVKVDLAVPEVVNQVCFKVIDNDTTTTVAIGAGQLQLNVMESIVGQVMFESAYVLTNAYYNPLGKCINGITVDKEVHEGYVYNSIGTVTYLNLPIGYHSGDIMDKTCAETGKNVREVVLERGLSTKAGLDGIFSVQNLMHPTHKAECYTGENEQ